MEERPMNLPALQRLEQLVSLRRSRLNLPYFQLLVEIRFRPIVCRPDRGGNLPDGLVKSLGGQGNGAGQQHGHEPALFVGTDGELANEEDGQQQSQPFP